MLALVKLLQSRWPLLQKFGLSFMEGKHQNFMGRVHLVKGLC